MASMTWSLQMELANQPIRFIDLRPGEIRSQFNDVMGYTHQEHDMYAENLKRASEIYDGRMRAAPPPERVAEILMKITERGGSGSPVVASGNLFQARVAPLLAQFASPGLLRWFMKKYYGLRR